MCSIGNQGLSRQGRNWKVFCCAVVPWFAPARSRGLLCDLPGVRIGANLLGFLSYLHNTRIIPVVLYINYTYIIIYIWLYIYIYVQYTITYILHINYMHPSIFAYAHWQSSMKTSWKHLCCFLLFLLRPRPCWSECVDTIPGIGEVKVHATQPWSSVVKSKPLGEVQHVFPVPWAPTRSDKEWWQHFDWHVIFIY